MPHTDITARHDGDRVAIECARIARALAVFFGTVSASLHAHYAARISAAAVCIPGGAAAAAVAALQQERDAAIMTLRQSHHHQRDRALRDIRRHRGKRRRFVARRNLLAPKRPEFPVCPLGWPRYRP